jgi:hypothetical protein
MSRKFLTKILTKEETTEFDCIQEIDVYIKYNSNVFIQLLWLMWKSVKYRNND